MYLFNFIPMSYNKNYENNYEHDINNPAILQCLVDKVFFLIHLLSVFSLEISRHRNPAGGKLLFTKNPGLTGFATGENWGNYRIVMLKPVSLD